MTKYMSKLQIMWALPSANERSLLIHSRDTFLYSKQNPHPTVHPPGIGKYHTMENTKICGEQDFAYYRSCN
jgi:hypothetical protein